MVAQNMALKNQKNNINGTQSCNKNIFLHQMVRITVIYKHSNFSNRKNGKKTLAQNIVNDTFDIIKSRLKRKSFRDF